MVQDDGGNGGSGGGTIFFRTIGKFIWPLINNWR